MLTRLPHEEVRYFTGFKYILNLIVIDGLFNNR